MFEDGLHPGYRRVLLIGQQGSRSAQLQGLVHH